MAMYTPRDWTDDELVAARYFTDMRAALAERRGMGDPDDAEDVQATIDHSGLPLLAPSFGVHGSARSLPIRHEHTGSGSTFALVGLKSGALANGDRVELHWLIRNGSGTVETLALVRFEREGSGAGKIEIYPYSGGSIAAAPALTVRTSGLVGAAGEDAPGYSFDVGGTVNAEEWEGVDLWPESPAGTVTNAFGHIEVSHQLESTASTGTAPFAAGTAATVANLNADLLSGVSWLDDQASDTGSATLSTAGVDEPIASVTASDAGLYLVAGEVEVTVASGDTSARFSIAMTGAAAQPDAKAAATGEKIQLAAVSMYVATAGATISLTARKSAGSGSSAAAGSLEAYRIGV